MFSGKYIDRRKEEKGEKVNNLILECICGG